MPVNGGQRSRHRAHRDHKDKSASDVFQQSPCQIEISPRRRTRVTNYFSIFIFVASILHPAAAQSCISLDGSTTCPAFNRSFISTDSQLTGLFPFLANVTDLQSFDSQLQQYTATGYVRSKYQNLFACQDINYSNTSDLYARYTYSFICNAIIQNSIKPCNASASDSSPLCADSCSDFALSEQLIVSSPQLCNSNSNSGSMSQLRADFTNCALPANSISGTCIPGYENEPDNCGFQSNLQGLCTYCASSSVNSTDSCCINSKVNTRCANVHLPSYVSVQPLFPSSTSSSAPQATGDTRTSTTSHRTLSGGDIAGIVVGSVVGAAVLLALLVLCCVCLRRRRQRDEKSSLNQPTPPRTGSSKKPSTNFTSTAEIPGARVARLTALEGSSGASPQNGLDGISGQQTPSRNRAQNLNAPAPAPRDVAAADVPKREKSLHDGFDQSSPESNGYSSYETANPNQSEQLDSFKDYYSTDDIRPGDSVSTLWAYQPRAPDEFELERGDMIRVVGIWDDGWATGVRIRDRAEDYEPGVRPARDSGVSNSPRTDEFPMSSGDVKAFPIVCVCLPQHWRKTIEGDLHEPGSSDGPPAP